MALARALGITREATYLWGETVPLGRQYQLQVITAGRLVATGKKNRGDHQ